MAFESVNVNSLRNAINACLNSLNHNTADEIRGRISDNNIWGSSSRDNLNKSLDILINERYNDLKISLKLYLNVADMIEEYKNLERKNQELKVRLTSLRSRLYYTESYTVSDTDSKGNTTTSTETRTVKDYAVERQIRQTEQQIRDNTESMNRLQNRVAQAVS